MPARRTHKPAKSKRARIYGVKRVDHERSRTHAWHVTITRQWRTFSHTFSDGVCGGKRAALKAAIRYRDEVIAKHALLSRRDYADIKRKNNRSGVPGVCRVAKPRNYFGKESLEWFWVATWTPEPRGPHKRKSYSVKRYGAKPRAAVKNIVSYFQNGIPGVELRMPLLFSEGVGKGRIDLNTFVSLTATMPAKLHNLYPAKGTIAVGSDADIALWDPAKEVSITHNKLHDNVDYTPYEGMKIKGYPVVTLSRGNIVWEDGVFKGMPGSGRFIARTPSPYARPPGRNVLSFGTRLND